MTDTKKPARTPTWIRRLEAMAFCKEGLTYCRGFKTWDAFWAGCDRGDWLLWVAGRLAGPPESEARKLLVKAAVACAETAFSLIKNEGMKAAVRECLDVALRWTEGKATIEEVRKARYAVYAADAYAAYADSDADAAHAAYAVAHAVYAAYTVDAAPSACAVADDAAAAHAYAAAANADADNAAYVVVAANAAAARSQSLKETADIVRKFYPVMAMARRRVG